MGPAVCLDGFVFFLIYKQQLLRHNPYCFHLLYYLNTCKMHQLEALFGRVITWLVLLTRTEMSRISDCVKSKTSLQVLVSVCVSIRQVEFHCPG